MSMHIGYDEQQLALRDELRTYFNELMTPELEEELATTEGGGPLAHAIVRKMGADGWLGVGWPREYGGQDRSTVEQFIFFDEAQRANVPLPFLTINTVGPSLQTFGTQAQKDEYLPRILRGECRFSIGYTEPEAGTDLAALSTRAGIEDDQLVINGQKIFTSLVDHADYVWLACRTDPEAPKHRGISIVIVPTTSPGFSYTPIETMGDARTFVTYYQDVRVSLDNVVGGLHEGWKVITRQLNFERVSLCTPGQLERHYDAVVRWARQHTVEEDVAVLDLPWVRTALARVRIKLEALRLVNFKVAWDTSQGRIHVEDSSATKAFGTEAYCECYGLLLEVLGARGLLRHGSAEAVLGGRLERAYRGTLILTFGGGTNEIQRDLIAMFGLGMPKVTR